MSQNIGSVHEILVVHMNGEVWEVLIYILLRCFLLMILYSCFGFFQINVLKSFWHPNLPHISCITLGNLFNIPESQFLTYKLAVIPPTSIRTKCDIYPQKPINWRHFCNINNKIETDYSNFFILISSILFWCTVEQAKIWRAVFTYFTNFLYFFSLALVTYNYLKIW